MAKQSQTTPSPDACAENPCRNGGICRLIGGTGDFTCHCPKNFTGEHCEAVPVADSPAPLIAGLVCAVLLIIGLLIVIYFVVKKAKEKRRQHGTYSPSREEQAGRRIELNQVLKPPPIERLI